MGKQAILRQEMGDKKYQQMVEKSNKDYDKYKAGKVDPKTGIRNREISFTDPREGKIKTKYLCTFQCDCGKGVSINETTAGVICSGCKKYLSIKYDRETTELFVNGESIGRLK